MADLSEEEMKILLAVEQSEKNECDFLTLVQKSGLTETKTKYYLDKLTREWNFLHWIGNMNPNVPDRYRLTREGRAFLVEGNYV